MPAFARTLVVALALACTHAAPADPLRGMEHIVEQAGMSRWSEALALLRALLRPWISSSDLEEFMTRIAGHDPAGRRLGVPTVEAIQTAPALDAIQKTAPALDAIQKTAPALDAIQKTAPPVDAVHPKPADRRTLQMTATPSTDVIKPEYLSSWIDEQEWRSFPSASSRTDGQPVTIQYVTARGSGTRGAVVVSVGNAEPAEKYSEQMHDLLAAGFSPVYVLDHRGQGRSTRLLDDSFKSHVDAFGHFVQDFRALVDSIVGEQGAEAKLFLHCHSMGCAIAFRFLIEEFNAQRPNRFRAVAASSPLIKPNTDPFPYGVAVLIGQAMLLLGLGEEYPPSRGRDFETLYAPDGTESRRHELYLQYCHDRRNTAYPAGHTGLCLGDPTAAFAADFFGVYETFTAFEESSGSLSVPILLQQAKTTEGGHDGTVMNDPQEAFCSASCDACTLTRYPTSAHNIWFETDAIRTAALEEAYAFYETHGGTLVAQNSLPPPACSWYQFWCGFGGCSCRW